MNKAIFLDRDGVINHPKRNYYVYRIEDFRINSGVIEALQHFQEKDYLLFVITNQGGISKGKYTAEDVENVHAFMKEQLHDQGIYLSAIYYCPHHSSKENCLCRKPKPLMLEKAMAQFDIDPGRSWFIGDKKTDVEAGIAAGVRTIKIRKNQDLRKLLKKVR
jgi:D-glycero-D-manno-heptose 1,7-bisphosphate phosphatase